MVQIIIFGDIDICSLYISVDGSKELTIFGKRPRYLNLSAGNHYITATTVKKFQRAVATPSVDFLSALSNAMVSHANTSLAGEVYFDENDVLLLQVKQRLTKSVIYQKMINISQVGRYVDMDAMVDAWKQPAWKKWVILSLCLFFGINAVLLSQSVHKTDYDRISGTKTDRSVMHDEPATRDDALIPSNAQEDFYDTGPGNNYQEPEGYTLHAGYTLDTQMTAGDAADYILPGSDSRYLTRSDLEGLSKEECRLARNELYARHGRKFNDADLADYFSQFDWYYPTIEPDSFDDSMFNAFEIANRDLIVQFEKEQGYR